MFNSTRILICCTHLFDPDSHFGKYIIWKHITFVRVTISRTTVNPYPTQQAQNIWITFVQFWSNVEDVGSTLYKTYTNVLCLLDIYRAIILKLEICRSLFKKKFNYTSIMHIFRIYSSRKLFNLNLILHYGFGINLLLFHSILREFCGITLY